MAEFNQQDQNVQNQNNAETIIINHTGTPSDQAGKPGAGPRIATWEKATG
ncbi:MAG: hypothetical protein GY779_06800, partial [Gammaproteobacteria bacterium]|nr:hypothetical protein [Gammaproteobacteria bacterium]